MSFDINKNKSLVLEVENFSVTRHIAGLVKKKKCRFFKKAMHFSHCYCYIQSLSSHFLGGISMGLVKLYTSEKLQLHSVLVLDSET